MNGRIALERDAAGIAALADPVRRRLYQYVCAQPAPVSRDQAAEALDIPLHQAKFHMDRLTSEGLLDCDYARLSGRSGPGAGRTSKLYRRAGREIVISLPPREYELAGRLMAAAIARSADTEEPVAELLNRIAREYGRTIGVTAGDPPPVDPDEALVAAMTLLSDHGYEPRREDGTRSGDVELANCPFHALAQEQTELACAMNHALITGVADALRPYSPDARLAPGPDRCCVVLTPCAAQNPPQRTTR